MTVYTQAKRLVAAGISVVPIKPDGSKAPACGGWKTWQHRLPTEYLGEWFARTNNGIAIVAGAVSGNVEVIDFDDVPAFAEWWALLADDQGDLLSRLVITRTPGPGMQVWYRCVDAVPGNTKLARIPREDGGWETLIETRGNGGYALIPPSPPECHPTGRTYAMFQGDLAEMPTITTEDRIALIGAAQSLNRYVEPQRAAMPPRAAHQGDGGGGKPGDLYNAKGCWESLLVRHGWVVERRGDPVIYWRRPGKSHGISATLHAVAPGVLYVFSGNAAPFEQERSYDLFGAMCLLEHGGDFKAPPKAQRRVPANREAPPVATAEAGNYDLDGLSVSPEEDATGWKEVEEAPMPEDAPGGDIEGESKDSTRSAGAKYGIEWAREVSGKFLFADGDSWMEYRDHRWTPVSESTAHGQCQKWLETRPKRPIVAPSSRFVTEIIRTARHRLGDDNRPMSRKKFDSNPGLLPLANGMLDVETRVLREHSPKHLNTYCLPYGYDPKATCPRFDQFLREVLLTEEDEPCQEWIDQLYEWTGYCLIPSYRAETILVNVGEGGNGKSLYEKMVQEIVGADQCVALDLKQLAGNHAEYELASVFGKLVAFINEPQPKHLSDCIESLKKISSGDQIKGRMPAERPFSYTPYARLMINCNEMPNTKDPTMAMKRRLLFLNWRRANKSNNDRELEDTLRTEVPGILNRALDGLDRLRERKWQFVETDASMALRGDHFQSEDSIAQFLESSCECDPKRTDIWSVPMALYDEYARWCKRAGYMPENVWRFGRHLTLRLKFPKARPKMVNGRMIDVRYGVRHMGAYEQVECFGSDSSD